MLKEQSDACRLRYDQLASARSPRITKGGAQGGNWHLFAVPRRAFMVIAVAAVRCMLAVRCVRMRVSVDMPVVCVRVYVMVF